MTSKKIGAKIAEARKKTNISQAQLAERLFISPQAVGKWERGESMPDITTFNRMAEILGVDLNYFSGNFPSTAPGMEKPTTDLRAEPRENMLRWDMSSGNWLDADFSGLKNLKEKFSSSNMKNCKFVGSDLSGLLLKNNNIAGCDFSHSEINNSQIQNSYLSDNYFNGCTLNDAEFLGTYISGCDFSGTNFTGVVVKSGGLEKNTLTRAIWNRTSFIDTHLADMVFEGAINDCYFEYCDFTRITFQNSVLQNTFFKCKSLKKLKFIDCTTDRMTYEFLKNGKADLGGITIPRE